MSLRRQQGLIDHGPRGTSRSEGLVFQAAVNSPLKIYRDSGEGPSTPIVTYDMAHMDNTPVRSLNQVQVLDQGAGILVRTPDQANLMLRCDSETGKTTDEIIVKYNAGGYRPIKLDFVTPLEKFSQYEEPSSTLELAGIGGADGNTVFQMTYDPRTGEEVKLNTGNSRKYAASQKAFTALATSRNGFAVVGDAVGNVRLFEDFSKKGKAIMKLDQYADGEPVVGIDVSSKGTYIVWNTAEEVYVVRFPEGYNSWSSSGKPTAVRLSLREEHKSEIGSVDFGGIKFDRGPATGANNVIESEVLTFSGCHAVSWNMRNINKTFNQIDEDLANGKELDRTPVVYSSKIIKTTAPVIDHIPLAGLANKEIAGLADGIEHLNI